MALKHKSEIDNILKEVLYEDWMSDQEYQVLVNFTIENTYSTIGLLDSLIDGGHYMGSVKSEIMIKRYQYGDLKKLIRG